MTDKEIIYNGILESMFKVFDEVTKKAKEISEHLDELISDLIKIRDFLKGGD
jgi:hypothetical protein